MYGTDEQEKPIIAAMESVVFGVTGTLEDKAIVSLAVSMKRIADAMETEKKQDKASEALAYIKEFTDMDLANHGALLARPILNRILDILGE